MPSLRSRPPRAPSATVDDLSQGVTHRGGCHLTSSVVWSADGAPPQRCQDQPPAGCPHHPPNGALPRSSPQATASNPASPFTSPSAAAMAAVLTSGSPSEVQVGYPSEVQLLVDTFPNDRALPVGTHAFPAGLTDWASDGVTPQQQYKGRCSRAEGADHRQAYSSEGVHQRQGTSGLLVDLDRSVPWPPHNGRAASPPLVERPHHRST